MKTPSTRLYLAPAARISLLLIVLFGALRFVLVLLSYRSGHNGWVAGLFVLMILLPFIMLNRQGRSEMGLVAPRSPWWLLGALFDGALLALIIGWIGQALYGEELSNWYAYIRGSYPWEAGMNTDTLHTVFLISAGTSMVFSPLGEEFFYRGQIHRGLRSCFSPTASTLIDSGAFALTHLCHFGLVFDGTNWLLLPKPAALWVTLMFVSALLFSLYKALCRSLWGAVCCHAGFNLGMTYYIFYLL